MKFVQDAVLHTTENSNFTEDQDFPELALPFYFFFLSSSKRSLPHTLPLQISSLWRCFPERLRSVTEWFTVGIISHASPGSQEICTPDFCTALSLFSVTGQFLLDTFHTGISWCVPLHNAQTLIKSSSTQLAFGEPTTNPFRIHYTKAAAELGTLSKAIQSGKEWLHISILLLHSPRT